MEENVIRDGFKGRKGLRIGKTIKKIDVKERNKKCVKRKEAMI